MEKHFDIWILAFACPAIACPPSIMPATAEALFAVF
jgi:hypothetical protein